MGDEKFKEFQKNASIRSNETLFLIQFRVSLISVFEFHLPAYENIWNMLLWKTVLDQFLEK